jgi:polyferredoxin
VTGLRVPILFPLLAFTSAGYILEILQMKKVSPACAYISRNNSTCTHCNLCTKSCPQEIDVAGMDRVTHIDCNLCGDCLYACPEKDTLQINRKNMKWLPGTVLGVLIIAGFVMGSVYELPTVNLKWGDEVQLSQAKSVTVEHMQNIRCYGTSVMFADKLRQIEGIYGISTFTGRHSVNVLFDDKVHNENDLKDLLVRLQADVSE